MTEKPDQLTLRFLGGAGTVTGSKYLVETPSGYRCLVDCGLFQGLKKLRKRNWQSFPVDPSTIDDVILTHGHLDHTGYLPRLVKLGYDGPIHATPPTRDITSITLRDSAKIQEEEAKRANKKGYSKHDPALPLYTVDDAKRAINQLKTKSDNTWHTLSSGISYRHRRAGHILGATFVEMKVGSTCITFSGDLGRSNDPLMPEPEAPDPADLLLVESTYGDRCHSGEDPADLLEKQITRTIDRGGSVLIPSFAVERAQHLMYLLHQLRQQNRIPSLPMYLDTPMGIQVSRLFGQHPGWHRITAEQWKDICRLFEPVETFSETEAVARNNQSKLVIAGSGMITGGRILHYLRHELSNPDSTLILVGYQAEGTRGRKLRNGASEIKFDGTYFPVKLNVETIDALSAHANREELLDWCSGFDTPPERVFPVHGENQALDEMRLRLRDRFDWDVRIPRLNETFDWTPS